VDIIRTELITNFFPRQVDFQVVRRFRKRLDGDSQKWLDNLQFRGACSEVVREVWINKVERDENAQQGAQWDVGELSSPQQRDAVQSWP